MKQFGRLLVVASLTLGLLSIVPVALDAAGAAYTVQRTVVPYRPDAPFRITDVRYADKSNFETRTVEILQPVADGGVLRDRPVIFFVHGGGWVDGYADWYTQFLTPTLVATEGFVVVNVDYRLTSDQVFLAATYPLTPTKAAWYADNIQDVANALGWTAQHIAEYGGDPQNIFLLGHSAGGHLVSLLATHDSYRDLRTHIRAVVSLSGAYQLDELNPLIFNPLLDQTFTGGHTDQAALQAASPGSYVQPGATLPPFYVLHCQLDLPSLPEQAIAFRNQLELTGHAVTWDYLLDYTHESEMTALADGQETVTQLVVAYILAHVHKTVYLPSIAAP